MRIIAVIDVTIETTGAMEPGTRSNENTANEPVRPIIAIGRTAIRGIVEVSVGANRRRSNIYGNLSRCYRHAAHQRDGKSGEGKQLPSSHDSSFDFFRLKTPSQPGYVLWPISGHHTKR
jgi:hypothetical protein